MRIAVSADTNQGLESQVAHHFGRCPYFVLVDLKIVRPTWKKCDGIIPYSQPIMRNS